MGKEINIRFKKIHPQKLPVGQDGLKHESKYNKDMQDETIQAKKNFAKMLASARMSRGLSARELSLALGQGSGYINNIENGRNLPSMSMFFEICEYLDLSPGEFFDYSIPNEGNARQMLAAFVRLDPEVQELIITLTERLRRG